jgi:hypothetical protein
MTRTMAIANGLVNPFALRMIYPWKALLSLGRVLVMFAVMPDQSRLTQPGPQRN